MWIGIEYARGAQYSADPIRSDQPHHVEVTPRRRNVQRRPLVIVTRGYRVRPMGKQPFHGLDQPAGDGAAHEEGHVRQRLQGNAGIEAPPNLGVNGNRFLNLLKSCRAKAVLSLQCHLRGSMDKLSLLFAKRVFK
jgi:hypothetical protein